MINIDQAVNLKVKVTTLLDQPTTGYIYAYSPVHEILTLRLTNNYLKSSDSDRKENYKFINTAFIKTIQVLAPFPKKISSPNGSNSGSKSPSPAPPSPQLVQLSINELETSLNKAVAQHKEMLSVSQNRQVSSTATLLFEKLYTSFNGNVVWGANNESIIVNDEVKILKPYLAKSGSITKINNNVNNNQNLDRVFQIVKEFWQNIENDRIGG